MALRAGGPRSQILSQDQGKVDRVKFLPQSAAAIAQGEGSNVEILPKDRGYVIPIHHVCRPNPKPGVNASLPAVTIPTGRIPNLRSGFVVADDRVEVAVICHERCNVVVVYAVEPITDHIIPGGTVSGAPDLPPVSRERPAKTLVTKKRNHLVGFAYLTCSIRNQSRNGLRLSPPQCARQLSRQEPA